MSRKIKPLRGDHSVTEVPDFALSPRDAQALAAMLEVTWPDDIDRLKQELKEIGRLYLRWGTQIPGKFLQRLNSTLQKRDGACFGVHKDTAQQSQI